MSEDQKRKLEQKLWAIANVLRGKMDADDYRDYVLGFIFFKYLSERMNLFANDILEKDNVLYEDIDENTDEGKLYLSAVEDETIDYLGYFLKPSELFSVIADKGRSGKDNFILDKLQEVLNHIEESTLGKESEEDFINLFEDLDLTSSKLGRSNEDKNSVIVKVITLLDEIDFALEDSGSDLLGDAYEYLIGQFASGAGKKAGEFYTPQQVSKILAKVVTTGKKRIQSVYDPTCGSGSLLLRVAKEVDECAMFYGQELNRTTFNLARMNMILHGVHYIKFDIQLDDTIERPQHIGETFEALVANPPFSAKWSANKLFMSDDRFSEYGKLPPKSKADYAFVQHMIYHLAENGSMAIVLPHGVLFRGAAEGHIRRFLIEEKNYLDAVIGLPANIFYGTSIPTCIMVFKKCRDNPEDILFIDASQEFEKAKNQNYLRNEDVDKIVDTYRQRKEIEKYSHVATMEEIKENDYNLNIPRFVDTFEEEEPIDIPAVAKQIQELETKLTDNDKTIEKYCNELGVPVPW